METRLTAAIAAGRAAQPVLAVTVEEAPEDEASVVATLPDAPARPEGDFIEAPFDEDGPVWPDEMAESAMRVEVSSRGETLSSIAAREAAEAAAEAAAEKRGLPSLDHLIERLSPEVRDTLEDLFRVKFVKVLRVPKKALKS